jgi:hypothetical protein
MFLVPFLVSGLTAFLINRTVKSFEEPVAESAVVKQESAPPAADAKPENQDEQINISFGTNKNIAIKDTDEPKDMGKRLRSAVSDALTQVLMLPVTILVGSFSSIVIALLYLKTRQAGGESMQDLLSQFEETDQPDSNWQKRVRQRLIQSGRITSRGGGGGQSSSEGKRATDSGRLET